MALRITEVVLIFLISYIVTVLRKSGSTNTLNYSFALINYNILFVNYFKHTTLRIYNATYGYDYTFILILKNFTYSHIQHFHPVLFPPSCLFSLLFLIPIVVSRVFLGYILQVEKCVWRVRIGFYVLGYVCWCSVLYLILQVATPFHLSKFNMWIWNDSILEMYTIRDSIMFLLRL